MTQNDLFFVRCATGIKAFPTPDSRLPTLVVVATVSLTSNATITKTILEEQTRRILRWPPS